MSYTVGKLLKSTFQCWGPARGTQTCLCVIAPGVPVIAILWSCSLMSDCTPHLHFRLHMRCGFSTPQAQTYMLLQQEPAWIMTFILITKSTSKQMKEHDGFQRNIGQDFFLNRIMSSDPMFAGWLLFCAWIVIPILFNIIIKRFPVILSNFHRWS